MEWCRIPDEFRVGQGNSDSREQSKESTVQEGSPQEGGETETDAGIALGGICRRSCL